MKLQFSVAPILTLALSTTLALSSNPTNLQSQTPRFDVGAEARLEEGKDYAGAIDLLQQHYSELDQSEREHLAHLRAFVAISKSNSDNDLPPSNRSKALEELLAKFDQVNDVYLLYEGRRELNDLDAKAVSFRGSRLGQFWSRVTNSFENGDIWSFPVNTAWVLVAPGLFLLVLIYVFWRFWPREGFLISFEDLTVDGSSKPYKDRILTQEIQEACGVPRIDHTFGAVDVRVFAINDHDGSSFATLVPHNSLVVWSDIMQAGSPIKVGPVELNLKQLVALILGWLQSPTKHALVGSLHEAEGHTVLSAQRFNRSRRLAAGFSWRVQSESSLHPRRDLIENLSAQMLVDLLENLPTKSWRSYRSLLQGMEVFEQPPASDSCNCFDIARQHLWSALEEDPMNWMARFYLAIALRRCSANEEAANHLAAVAQLFAIAEKRLAGRLHLIYWLVSAPFLRRLRLTQWLVSRSFLERHLWKYPQCDLIVLYNRAMALSKLHNPPAMKEALSLLLLIVDLCDGNKLTPEAVGTFKDIPDVHAFSNIVPRLTKVDRQRFRRIAQSTQTVVWAAQAEYLCPGEVKPLREVLDKIKSVEDEIHDSATAADYNGGGSKGDSEIDLAVATVCCAKGKVQTMLHRTDDARASFNRAIFLAPNLVDAQLSLAASYVNNHGEDAPWIQAAESALEKALKLDASCPKAHYLFARLECSRKPPNYDQALNYLRKTEDLPEGFFLKAEIYASTSFSGRNLDASIKAWREGLERLPAVISSNEFYHLQKLQLVAEQHPTNGELQSIAQRATHHIGKNCPWQAQKWVSRVGDDHASAANHDEIVAATAGT